MSNNSEARTFLKESGIKSADYNPRFPNANQTKNCWANFVEHHRCVAYAEEHGIPLKRCARFKLAYKDICPEPLLEKWTAWVEENKFPGQEAWKHEEPASHKHH
eukprot:CAMPEP_0168540870 /NCGR_PEP_ID=MMETSP0413-20121227/509_1 /TAXON_ID=136452 /ORGANISM="Filamoeba nolandi, Strain NC-AS-23-1" /LENGTH=103 /DNA_ID=CAMNT_0008570637 /DNA_START=32 /DNA_END=343 /DNA_ORIENTATION=+